MLELYDCVPIFNLAFRSSRLLVMLVLLYYTTIPTSSRTTNPTAVEEGENTVWWTYWRRICISKKIEFFSVIIESPKYLFWQVSSTYLYHLQPCNKGCEYYTYKAVNTFTVCKWCTPAFYHSCSSSRKLPKVRYIYIKIQFLLNGWFVITIRFTYLIFFHSWLQSNAVALVGRIQYPSMGGTTISNMRLWILRRSLSLR